ncbi:aquaporin-like protein [Rhizoclosmatium globosum]|uniref:Aquaporin-like protein n=1 Tax=Rhizoclosmatium globosum TaxID=329046 RepID=A0A1Y2CVH2_9FUNG|nr:aquaporin-like protein [Rhizoclosmatium globosum]|eukprot:ORY50886.1 aquaporin-like protein [Rhizoclosmatium globosum]
MTHNSVEDDIAIAQQTTAAVKFVVKNWGFATKLAIQSFTEFLGTFLFLFIAFGGVQSALKTNASALETNPSVAFIEIALTFGCGLAAAIFFTFRISGGALNPAVSFGLLVAGVTDVFVFTAYTVAQVIGSILACVLVAVAFPGDFKGANQLLDNTTFVQGFIIETVLTMGLVLLVLFLAVEKSKITFWAPMMIGIYVFTAHLLAIPYTNTSLNPARTVGAAVVTGIWDHHFTLFWFAPFTGAAIAGGLYRFYKVIDYHTLNPGQDSDGSVSENFEEILEQKLEKSKFLRMFFKKDE